MKITSLLLPAQEVEPSSTAWLPVMPITSGELTLRPAGTVTHAMHCTHSCSCDVYAAAACTVQAMTCLHCAVRDDDEPEHVWAEGIRLPPLLQACACSCLGVPCKHVHVLRSEVSRDPSHAYRRHSRLEAQRSPPGSYCALPLAHTQPFASALALHRYVYHTSGLPSLLLCCEADLMP